MASRLCRDCSGDCCVGDGTLGGDCSGASCMAAALAAREGDMAKSLAASLAAFTLLCTSSQEGPLTSFCHCLTVSCSGCGGEALCSGDAWATRAS